MPGPRAKVVYDDPDTQALLGGVEGLEAGKKPIPPAEPPDETPEQPPEQPPTEPDSPDDPAPPDDPDIPPGGRDVPAEAPDPGPAASSSTPTAGLKVYESRIHIVEAWQYPGSLADAPVFVERDWAAYADRDVLRRLEPGPALRVPVAGQDKLCRIGDYVVRQKTTLLDGLEPEEGVDVWEKDEFERLFIPRRRQRPAVYRPFGMSKEDWDAREIT